MEDYFDQRFEFFQEELKSINLNYDLLRESDSNKVRVYEKRLNHLFNSYIEEDAFKIELDGLNENRVTLDYAKMRKNREI